MSWRDNLRPGSFRGIPFEVRRTGVRLGRRGAHFEYPNRDKGSVEDLGLKDRRFTIDAYVIGEDFIQRRDALEAALQQPGSGELIHPTRGALQVVLDVNSDVSVRERSERGRMAVFSIPFLLADDTPQYPSRSASPVGKVEAVALAVVALAAAASAGRIALAGPAHVAETANADLTATTAEIDALRPLALGDALGQGQAAGFDIGAISRFDPANPISALDGILSLMEDVLTVFRAGTRVLVAARGVANATRALLASLDDPVAPLPVSIADRRIVENRKALQATVHIAAISYTARALVSRDFDSHDDAFYSLRAFDSAIETVIRREADIAGSDATLVRNLSSLRAVTREALIANAAALIPVAHVNPGTSLPSLALSWRVSGEIDMEGDLVARNRVAHPMWCPAEAVAVRAPEGRANA